MSTHVPTLDVGYVKVVSDLAVFASGLSKSCTSRALQCDLLNNRI